jgi:hypothetical protein
MSADPQLLQLQFQDAAEFAQSRGDAYRAAIFTRRAFSMPGLNSMRTALTSKPIKN